MNRPPAWFRRRATLLVAAAIAIILYVMTRERPLSQAESEEVVNTFRFSRKPLPEVANHPPYKYVRKVHPSMRHIRAYLGESPYVARWAPGTPRQGGDGVSVVELR